MQIPHIFKLAINYSFTRRVPNPNGPCFGNTSRGLFSPLLSSTRSVSQRAQQPKIMGPGCAFWKAANCNPEFQTIFVKNELRTLGGVQLHCWYRNLGGRKWGEKVILDLDKSLSPFRVLFLNFLTTKNNCTTLHTSQILASVIFEARL